MESSNKELKISYEKGITNIQEIIDLMSEQGISIIDIRSYDADLEDVFLSLTKK